MNIILSSIFRLCLTSLPHNHNAFLKSLNFYILVQIDNPSLYAHFLQLKSAK